MGKLTKHTGSDPWLCQVPRISHSLLVELLNVQTTVTVPFHGDSSGQLCD